jgi:hypothetical protein
LYDGSMVKHAPRALGSALALLSLAGCGGPGANSPRVKIESRHFSDSHVQFGFQVAAHETPPPGFKPTPTVWPTCKVRESRIVEAKEGGGGVITLAVRGKVDGEYVDGIAHTDDTAPILMDEDPRQPKDRQLIAVVPLVGPAGQRLSRAYRIHLSKILGGTRLVALSGDLPRVSIFCDDWSEAEARAIDGPEPDLYLPLDLAYKRVPLPAGVVGATYMRGGAWLVRWKGASGEGWSVARNSDLSDHKDREPRWSSARVARSAAGSVVIGERPGGGACDVVGTEARQLEGLPKETTATTCEAALAELEIKAKDKERADYEVRSKTEAEQAAVHARRRADEAASKKEEEEQRAKEAPVVKAYVATVGKDPAAACSLMKDVKAERHAQLVLSRISAKPSDLPELDCARQRKLPEPLLVQLNTERTRISQALFVPVRELSARERAPGPGIGAGLFSGGSSPSNSAAEQLKRTNEATYGSGKGSSCPHTDVSLCKK